MEWMEFTLLDLAFPLTSQLLLHNTLSCIYFLRSYPYLQLMEEKKIIQNEGLRMEAGHLAHQLCTIRIVHYIRSPGFCTVKYFGLNLQDKMLVLQIL